MKNVIFLFTGESRTSPFSNNEDCPFTSCILDSYNKYIFTNEFNNLYKYKIYVSTDDLNVEKTISYFSINNIGNIHLCNRNFYLKETKHKIPTIDYFIDSYNNQNWHSHKKYVNSIHQHYKILDCYNLFTNDDSIDNCDYIIRIRMDIEISINILEILKLFTTNPQLNIAMRWDLIAIGRPKIMECYCTGLNYKYGKYNFNVDVPNILPICQKWHFFKNHERSHWAYAPEIQLFAMLFEYCNNNNIEINASIVEIIKQCYIIRLNGDRQTV